MVNFPSSFDTNTTLYLAVNNIRTRLTAGIDDSVTTIPVLDTTGFPPTGYITILSGDDITKAEAMTYTGLTGSSFTGVTRGAGGTTALEHFASDNVDLTIVADHHNALKEAVIALENFVGVSGSENFVPLDDEGSAFVFNDFVIGDSLTISGVANLDSNLTMGGNLTVSGAATLCYVTVTGSAIVSGTVDVGTSLTVPNITSTAITTSGIMVVDNADVGWLTTTGTAEFCGDVTAKTTVKVGASQVPLYAENDEQITTLSESFTDSDCETEPLIVGDDYLVIYSAVIGGNDFSGATVPHAQLLNGSQQIGLAYDRVANDNSEDPSPHGGALLSGFTVVSGTGLPLKFQYKRTEFSGAQVASMKGQTIVAIPLGLLERNVDYFYEVQQGPELTVTNAPTTFSGAGNKVLESTFNVPTSGTYLYMGSVEGQDNVSGDLANRIRAKFFGDGGAGLSPEFSYSPDAGSLFTFVNFTEIDILDLDAGAHTFTIEGASTITNNLDFSRGRNILVNTASFDQLSRSRRTSVLQLLNPVSTADHWNTGTNITSKSYTPNQNERVLILGHAVGSSQNSNGTTRFAWTNGITSNGTRQDFLDLGGEIFREESGWSQGLVGLGVAGDTIPTFHFFMYPVNEGETKNWSFRGREGSGGGTDSHIGDVGSLNATPSDMFLWSMTSTPNDIKCTELTISGVTAHKITADCINVSESLTISGVPVATGTEVTIPDPLNIGTGNFTTSLTISGVPVATGTEAIIPDPLNLGTGNFSISLTISGVPVSTGTEATVPDPLNIGTGNFSTSLTISGVPVSTGTGGGGGSNIDDINSISSGSITIAGSGGIAVNTVSQTITIDGSSISGSGGSGGGGEAVGSGTYWVTDAPPASGTGIDKGLNDEFDTLPYYDTSVWSKWDPDEGTALSVYTEGEDIGDQVGLGILHDGLHFTVASSGVWAGLVRPIADFQDAPGDWWVDTKFTIGERSDKKLIGGLMIGGDVIGDPTGAKIAYIGLANNITDVLSTLDDSSHIRFQTNVDASDTLAAGTTITSNDSEPQRNSAYFRIAYLQSANQFCFYYSDNGNVWTAFTNDAIASGSLGFDPEYVGLIGRGLEATFGAPICNFQYFRYAQISDFQSANIGFVGMTRLPTLGRRVSVVGQSGFTDTVEFFAANSSGGSVNVRNTVTIEDGLIKSWTQVV